MDEETRNALAAQMLAAIEELGVPTGAWLVDIDRMREDLDHTQTVLRRMENAIIRAAKPLDDDSSARPTVRSRRTSPLPPRTPAATSARGPLCEWRALGRGRRRR
ncbi:MAG TPA: hypothetical protein VGQ84_02765 [Gaiellaceae bacterium]|nr:hypothetical protein [Gaiellaceae bacterium]